MEQILHLPHRRLMYPPLYPTPDMDCQDCWETFMSNPQEVCEIIYGSDFGMADVSPELTALTKNYGNLNPMQAEQLDETLHTFIDNSPIYRAMYNYLLQYENITKKGIVCNQKGEIVRILLTSGNKADNNEKVLTELLADLGGNIYGDNGYITKLKPYFQEKKVKLITKVRKNMKPEKLSQEKKYFLYKRGLIETVIDVLKNECQIEHTRHRSPKNFLVNLWSAIIVYKFLDKKPSIEELQEKKLSVNIEFFQDIAA
jgi:hypothetical protein